MATPKKPTKAQIAEAKIRASASGIKMDQSAKGLRSAGKAMIKGAVVASGPIGASIVAASAAKKLADKKAAAKATSGVRPTVKAVEKARTTAKATPKPKGSAMLRGEAAAEAVRKSTTPKGVKEFEKGASKALDKKYPGLYKNGKK